MTKQAFLKIHGLVQGVYFRYHSRLEAQKLGLVGYVSNMKDGSVEIVAQGPEKALKNFIEWCYNGVEGSRIDKVEIDYNQPIGKFVNFVIR